MSLIAKLKLIENLDWNNRVIFVPDSKTPTGRRNIPMSDRVVDVNGSVCRSSLGLGLSSRFYVRSHLLTIDKQFRLDMAHLRHSY